MARGRKKKEAFYDNNTESLFQQMHDEVVEFILQGFSQTEVTDYLELNYNLQRENASRYFKKAASQILEYGDFDLEVVITQHVHYYEEAIRFFDSIGNYSAKATAMNAKEKLLKIFEEDEPDIEIENNVNINVEQLNYDIEKLTEKEKNRFNEIFNKVKFLNANNK